MNGTSSTQSRRRGEVLAALQENGLTLDEAKEEISRREAAAARLIATADELNRDKAMREARAQLFAKNPIYIVPNGHSVPSPPKVTTEATGPAVETGAPETQASMPLAENALKAEVAAEPIEPSAPPPPEPSVPAEVLAEAPQQKTDYSVEAIDLVKTYATDNLEVQALKGVSLAVPRGDMVAIMGPSGCGKTTLLNCLSGLDTVDGGVVRVDGVDLAQLSDDAKSTYRARSMGFVFQFYNLLPVLSAVENVELPLLVSGVPAREARERALRALELVHLSEWGNHRPAQLSGGQRQRVTIARALVNSPAIVWADEPTGDLDSKNADEIMELILGLNKDNGQTFVIVTHDIRVAEKTFRIINMLDGEIVDETVTESGKARAGAAGVR